MNFERRAKDIWKMAENYRDDTAKFLSDMVRIRSYSGQEEEICKHIASLCEDLDFDEVKIDGLGSVLARIGSGRKILAIDAHVDTVEVGDLSQWERHPFSGDIRDGLVYGRGSSDQKGGAAAMLSAGRILKKLNYDDEWTVWFAFTVMEEDCDGMCWKYLIEEEDLVPDFILSTEPTSCRLARGHRGRMEMELKLKGISAHGSAPERGDSAAYKAARAALAMEMLNEELKPDEEGFLGKGSIVVSQIDVKGPSQCAVPDVARLYMDRRLTWGENAELAIGQVKEKVGQALGVDNVDCVMPDYAKTGWRGTKYSQELYFPTWKTNEGHPLVQAGVRAYKGLFAKAPAVDKWVFSTNLVSASGRHGIPGIGFGPGDEKEAHAPNEVNRIEDLVICSAFYASLVYALEGVKASR
ncbi:Acetylornithine deacetylase [Olavius algarvensis spirochete endosymbiont]|uniref:YgeY family selenium metabolism-linked hydrolase n=1 Tax=Olavius algarvensis spirochete endosymbiont TaxID=260710 RepID=UPI000F236621|nr:YgeY family selenium metabolism-linked hydrolase [Olavius algarvensis spirochete endosymbiont]VDA99926.1 Acetylornithine deacetylase [Olavius algarvensis spirochete endosymbiont]